MNDGDGKITRDIFESAAMKQYDMSLVEAQTLSGVAFSTDSSTGKQMALDSMQSRYDETYTGFKK